MKILVENGSYHMLNLGDVSMLQVTLTRLRKEWPFASLYVLTDSPSRLAYLFEGVNSVSGKSRDIWLKSSFTRYPLNKKLQQITHKLNAIGKSYQGRYPYIANWLKCMAADNEADDFLKDNSYFSALLNADLIVSSGGGLINDWFQGNASAVLDTFQIAQNLRKTTAMFSLGLGPVEKPKIIKKAKCVLPKLNLLALREGVFSNEFLSENRISNKNTFVTGDDAIELAYSNRCQYTGNCIGFNLRIARHSEIPLENIPIINQVLTHFARKKDSEVIPVPVLIRESDGDLDSFYSVLGGFSQQRRYRHDMFLKPIDLIKQIGRCRLVLSGAYHSAVFALSQGIPVVALASSTYYQHKLQGLSNQFQIGCDVLSLNDPDFEAKLINSLEEAWNFSTPGKFKLIQTAVEQIKSSNDAYEHLFKQL